MVSILALLTTFWIWFQPIFYYIAFTIAPMIASAVITVAYLPQTWKTQRSKDVSGISFLFWILINIFLMCMWTNSLGAMIFDGRWQYFATETLNWGFAIWAFFQVKIWGKEQRIKERAERKAKGKKWWKF